MATFADTDERVGTRHADGLSDGELLTEIRMLEAQYKSVEEPDHRRHLSRAELEQVLQLVRCRLEMRHGD